MNRSNPFSALVIAIVVGGVAAGCSSDGTGLTGANLTTASVDAAAQAKTAAAPRINPECVALTARIDTLRKEGFVEGVEKASTGKSSTVTVKRASLAKMTELEKANAEFQAKCSTVGSGQTAAAGAAVAPVLPEQGSQQQVAKAPANQGTGTARP